MLFLASTISDARAPSHGLVIFQAKNVVQDSPWTKWLDLATLAVG